VQRLYSEKSALQKRPREAHSEESEATSTPLERATKNADKALRKARANFEKADFDAVAKGFALKAKATIAEDEVHRRVAALEETLEDLLTGLRDEVKETAQALREEYKEPRFETAEERKSHEEKMNEILKALTKNYAPDK
jgi:ClpP class serine protease